MFGSGRCDLGPDLALFSLLGRKPNGMSEYAFYSFFGGFDAPREHPGKRSFAQWLEMTAPEIVLVEHPTVDFQPVPTETLKAIEFDVRRLLSRDRSVLIFDSGGETRTGQVCKHMGASEAFPAIT